MGTYLWSSSIKITQMGSLLCFPGFTQAKLVSIYLMKLVKSSRISHISTCCTWSRSYVSRCARPNSLTPKRAAGYSHSYFDIAGLDLAAFPSSDDISAAAEMAAEETDSLIRLLGLRPQQLRNVSREHTELPGIDSWFRKHSTSAVASNTDDDGDDKKE